MASLYEHLERVREKPHHERRRIAFVSSILITGLVAAGWIGALASSDTLAIAPSQGEPAGTGLAEARNEFTSLLGAASAAIGASSSPASIVVVDGATFSTLDAPKDYQNDTRETVITF